MPKIQRPLGWWGKTQSAVERLIQKGKIKTIDGRLFYEGRPFICRDSTIDGGVYLGEGIREAIVVDFQRSPRLQQAYQEARERCFQNAVFLRERALRSVYEKISEQLRWDEKAVEEIVRKRCLQIDGKISLEVFFREGVRVCRHQGLACAALLEQFIPRTRIKSSYQQLQEFSHN